MIKEQQKTKENRCLRQQRVRAMVRAHGALPRLSVYRSLQHFYLQIIDDSAGKTLCAASDKEINDKKMKPVEKARAIGKLIAEKALAKKISAVVYDRGRFAYHGSVKAAAEGAREAGLKF